MYRLRRLGAKVLKCDSCSMSLSLVLQESVVMPGFFMYLCELCVSNRMEPRWLILSSVKSIGMNNATKKVIKDKRYNGEKITADEVL